MSDQSNPTEQVDTSTEESTTHPWGDDFDAERAWQTIQNLRGREKELESDSKAYKRLREDEDAQRQFLAELGYEIDEGTDTDTVYDGLDDEEDTTVIPDPRVDALQQQLNALLTKDATREFNSDLDVAAKEAGVSLSQRDRTEIQRESMANGFTPEATRKAIEAFKEDREAYRKQVIEEYRNSKKAPHVSSVGKGATQVPDLDDPTQRVEWMTQQAMDRAADS